MARRAAARSRCSPSIPSSKRSGGSLLGDRARIEHDPRDDGILIRSTAAGGAPRRAGGAPRARRPTRSRAAFDVVVVETVGVGQSETDVEEVCDTVAVVVQPGSGDVLQFLKAGIMEVPDVLVVTKADLGDAAAARAARPRAGAGARSGSRGTPVRRGLVAAAAERDRASWPTRSTPTASGSTSPSAGCARGAHVGAARVRAPSTASARCARWAGRREAERLLAASEPGLSVNELVASLEAGA